MFRSRSTHTSCCTINCTNIHMYRCICVVKIVSEMASALVVQRRVCCDNGVRYFCSCSTTEIGAARSGFCCFMATAWVLGVVCVVRTYLVIAVDICSMGKNNIRNVHIRVVAPTFQQILFRHNDVIVHGEDECCYNLYNIPCHSSLLCLAHCFIMRKWNN